ncbi:MULTISPECIES: hypothetical protein [Herbaspirillum]|uniref:Uncharacterized protein n=2 Tax=Herbaspirillum huttiense TaxID=863372 RepID=A0AAJ2H991_9BURK|nr:MULTISPECIES: hypothetical protein [Herbaspirillum]MDR9836849.1 hypothetical protein [Herbaspirillum huttiense]
MNFSLENLSRDEKVVLLYAEECVVNASGLLESVRLNGEDLVALKRLKEAKVIDFGRVPSDLLKRAAGKTYWVTFTDTAWDLAHQLRRERAARVGPLRIEVDEIIAARSQLHA